MERKKYFEIVNQYNKENNLARLIYRLIKFEKENLSREQILNRVFKITGVKQEVNKKLILEELDKVVLSGWIEQYEEKNYYGWAETEKERRKLQVKSIIRRYKAIK